jgi:hypothetical protein
VKEEPGASEPVAVRAEGHGGVSAGAKEVTGLSVTAGVFHKGEGLFGVGLPAGETIASVAEHSLGLTVAASETEAGDQLSGSPADVLGVLGSSAGGSAVYFAAGGRFAEDVREYEYVNAKGESEHASEEPVEETEANQDEAVSLYEWYQPAASTPARTTFIARLTNTPLAGPNDEGSGDEEDWSDFLGNSFPKTKTSRVSRDGGVVLFKSRRSLTGYYGGDSELFRYSAGEGGALGGLLCVSCNPVPAVAPQGDALLDGEGGGVRAGLEEPWLTRNLSADGDRMFFETPAALVRGDGNSGGGSPSCISTTGGAKGCDVYEWEADGEGSCKEESEDGGCLYLISSGSSSEQSYFGDASADGDDVFFFTRQGLIPSDQDELVDVYDAHECVKGEACEEALSAAPAECSDEACANSYTPPSAPSLLSSSQVGSGNLPEPTGSPPPPAGGTTHFTRAQLLAAALKKCRSKHNKHKRQACEAQARKRYPIKTTPKKGARTK